MPKVKMSDIKSGSENVKNVFRRTMSERTQKWLEKQIFLNEELIEIFEISENIERNSRARDFYQRLIKSQKIKFSREVFLLFSHNLFEVDALMHLIENAINITNEDKIFWLKYAAVTSASWFFKYFLENKFSENFGIVATEKRFNLEIAKLIARSRLNPKDVMSFLSTILDSLTLDELIDWYNESVSTQYVVNALGFLLQYENTPAEILQKYYDRTLESMYREAIAKHKNCPINIKLEWFEKTGNAELLPQDVLDVFIF